MMVDIFPLLPRAFLNHRCPCCSQLALQGTLPQGNDPKWLAFILLAVMLIQVSSDLSLPTAELGVQPLPGPHWRGVPRACVAGGKCYSHLAIQLLGHDLVALLGAAWCWAGCPSSFSTSLPIPAWAVCGKRWRAAPAPCP